MYIFEIDPLESIEVRKKCKFIYNLCNLIRHRKDLTFFNIISLMKLQPAETDQKITGLCCSLFNCDSKSTSLPYFGLGNFNVSIVVFMNDPSGQ